MIHYKEVCLLDYLISAMVCFSSNKVRRWAKISFWNSVNFSYKCICSLWFLDILEEERQLLASGIWNHSEILLPQCLGYYDVDHVRTRPQSRICVKGIYILFQILFIISEIKFYPTIFSFIIVRCINITFVTCIDGEISKLKVIINFS